MSASAVLAAAAELVDGWPEPYAEPLAELLRSEGGDAGWDRYPPGACLLRLAQGVVDDAARKARRAS